MVVTDNLFTMFILPYRSCSAILYVMFDCFFQMTSEGLC